MSAWNGDLCESFCWCCVAWMWALLLLSRLARLSGPQLRGPQDHPHFMPVGYKFAVPVTTLRFNNLPE